MAWIQLTDDEMKLIVDRLAHIGTPETKALIFKIEEKLKPDPIEALYLTAAQERYQDDGELEFDEGAAVSMGEDPGAYVMGWRWITNEEAGVPVLEE